MRFVLAPRRHSKRFGPKAYAELRKVLAQKDDAIRTVRNPEKELATYYGTWEK